MPYREVVGCTHADILAGPFLLHDTFVIEVRRGRDAPVQRHALHHVIAWAPNPDTPHADDAAHLAESAARVARELRAHAQHDFTLIIHDAPGAATGPALVAAARAWIHEASPAPHAAPPAPVAADPLAAAVWRLLHADGVPLHLATGAHDREHHAAMAVAAHLRTRHATPSWWDRLWRRGTR